VTVTDIAVRLDQAEMSRADAENSGRPAPGHRERRRAPEMSTEPDSTRDERRQAEAPILRFPVLAPPGLFRGYCGAEPPRFANRTELECAKILDYYGIRWDYEPRTFVLERGVTGRVVRAFTPDFYLPEHQLFIEVTAMKQSHVTRKNRKVRELRKLYPHVRVKVFYRRDIERLAQRYDLRFAV
jgi:hypothetical protein